jgi:hypothetical protein
MISKPMVHSTQIVHLSYITSTWASSPSGTIECVQNDFWAYGTLAQTMHLACTDTNTVSKWEEARFHMTHVT